MVQLSVLPLCGACTGKDYPSVAGQYCGGLKTSDRTSLLLRNRPIKGSVAACGTAHCSLVPTYAGDSAHVRRVSGLLVLFISQTGLRINVVRPSCL